VQLVIPGIPGIRAAQETWAQRVIPAALAQRATPAQPVTKATPVRRVTRATPVQRAALEQRVTPVQPVTKATPVILVRRVTPVRRPGNAYLQEEIRLPLSQCIAAGNRYFAAPPSSDHPRLLAQHASSISGRRSAGEANGGPLMTATMNDLREKQRFSSDLG